MATNQKNNIFAPPTPAELDATMFAPPKEEELKQQSAPKDVFAPPEPEEIKPTGIEGQVSPTDMQKIADKYKVPVEDLKTIAPYLGTKVQPGTPMEALTGGLKETAGLAGRWLVGAPQFIYKKLQTPSMQQAIDELQRIAREQQSWLELATEVVGPAGLGGATTAAGRIAQAATLGAATGLTGSEYGKEVQGTATGAGIGTVLGGAGELLGKVLSKSGASKVEQELATRNAQFDIGAETEKIAQQTQKSEDMLQELVTANKQTLSPTEVETIVKEQVSPEKLEKYLTPGTTENTIISRELAGASSSDKIKQSLADSIIENRIKDFAEELIGKRPQTYETAYEEIQKIAARQGEQATLNKYKQFVELQQASKAIEQSGIRATDTPNAIQKAINFVSDNQFVMRGLDQKYGTKLEGTLRELNKDYNRSSFPQKAFREQLDDVFQVARTRGVDDTVRGTDKIYSALDTGDISKLSGSEKEVAQQFKQYFADILEFVNKKVAEKDPSIAPLAIPRRETYVPKMLKPAEELIPAIENKIKEATQVLGVKDLAALSSGDLAKLTKENSLVKELYEAATLLDNRPIQTGAELSSRLKEMMYSRQGNIAMETKARAALERNDVIPDFLLEKNLYKLARKYADNTLKHLYLRNNIDRLRYQAKMLDKAGAEVESQYVKNLIQDLMGVRQGTFAEASMQSRIAVNRKIDELLSQTKNPVSQGALTAVKAVPDILEEMTRQIYPNVLGYGAIRPVMQNMTQLLTKTAPELGGTYGYSTVLRAAASMAKGGMRRELARLTEKAATLGNMPAEFTRKGEQAIAEGIQRSSLYKIPADVLAGMGKMGMKLFTLGEEINRSMAIKVAEVMAQDLAKGSGIASKALSRMPRTVQQEIARNPAQAETILSKYLNDATMYNYNRVSMSEYGRTMGPLFSAFSKWPTATVGEIVNEIQSKGIMKGMGRNWEKFVTPLLLLQIFDSLALNEENIATHVAGIDREGPSDVQKKLFGSYGLSQSAPIGAAGAILKGEIFTPPAVDAFLQTTVTPLLDGKDMGDVEDKLSKGASSAVMNFTPGAGLFRFLFDDLVTYATGERPEGTSGLERISSGIEEINK